MTGIDATVLSPGASVGTVQEIEVLESLGEPTRFRYRVAAPVADGDIPALARSGYDPGATAIVIASNAPMMHGVVTGQRVHLSGDSETSWIDVIGTDRSVEMDREAKVTSWQFMRSSDVVTIICATYGLIPNVEPTGTFHSPLTHELVQRGTDLAFVRRLARRNGCWFWISVNALGLEVANFKAPPVSTAAVTTLSLHLEHSAFDELDLEWDADRPTSVTAAGLGVDDLETIDASVESSSVSPMASQGLASINGGRSALSVAPGDDAASLTGPAQALLTDAGFFVRAMGTTTHSRVGRALHAHEVVRLDGLGRRHSGNWLVAQVRHLIDAVSHRMECTFVRNGWEA